MFYQTEAKPQGWRAVAVFDDRSERLLYLGRSSTQVRAGFTQAFFEVLDDEEREALILGRLDDRGVAVAELGDLLELRRVVNAARRLRREEEHAVPELEGRRHGRLPSERFLGS